MNNNNMENSNNPMDLIKKGFELRASGDLDGALKTFAEAELFPPTILDAHLGKASVYLRKHEPDKAINELKNALATDPASAQANTLLGLVYMEIGELNKAEVHFTNAITIDPTNKIAAQNLTRVLDQQNKYDELYELFHKLYPHHSQSPEFLFSFWRFMVEDSPMKNDQTLLKQAITGLDLCIQMGYSNHTIDYYYAKAYFALNDYDKCCKHIEKFFRIRRRHEGGRYMVQFIIDKDDIPKILHHVAKLEKKGDKVFIQEIDGIKYKERSLHRGPIINLG